MARQFEQQSYRQNVQRDRLEKPRRTGNAVLRVLYSFSDRIGNPGIGMIAWHQIVGLVEHGADVRVFCPAIVRPLPSAIDVCETLRPAGIQLPLRSFALYRPKKLHDHRVAQAARGLNQSIDIVHCWPGASLETLRIASEHDVPTVLERPNSHTRVAFQLVAEEHRRLGISVPRSHSHAFDQRRLDREEAEFELADGLLCPSEFVARSFLECGFSADKLLRHQYGYDPAAFPSDEHASRRDEGAPVTLAFVGRCEPRKGLHYALQAWHRSKARNGRFLICGEFVPGYREQLTDLLNHPGVTEYGFTNDVASIMRQSDALVLPSVEEGSALVTYEARACGCILLVSSATGAHCRHERDALVHEPRNVEMLARHMDILACDLDMRRRLREESRRSLNDLTWSAAAERLIDAYRTLLERRRCRSKDTTSNR